MKKPYMYQHLRAPNSPSGNPQRLYITFDAECCILDVIDEGYRGLPAFLRYPMRQLPTIEISRADYHDWKRRHAAKEF